MMLQRPPAMRCAVTVNLIPEARGGPFIFHDDLALGCKKAKAMGFDAIELFAPDGETIAQSELRHLLGMYDLKLAACGTGGGWLRHKLTLTDPDPARRTQAIDFVRRIIDAGAEVAGAPAIIGSMQGRWNGEGDRSAVLARLADALAQLADHARAHNTFVLYEPLNRYETDLVNTLQAGAVLLDQINRPNVRLLADLFHMNIEETDLGASIRAAKGAIGHVHLADSNRHPATGGHTPFAPVADALRAIGYGGYVSAEAFPRPDSDTAARMTRDAFEKYFAAQEG